MTESRARPVLDRKVIGVGVAPDAASDVALPSAVSEIPLTVIGIPSETPQGSQNASGSSSMHHKLHLLLRDLLKKKGQFARKASKACGVPLSTFNGYLKPDRHQIDPNHLLAMARYFDVSLDFILSGRESGSRIEGLPTKRLFSRWVKLTIEEIIGDLIKKH